MHVPYKEIEWIYYAPILEPTLMYHIKIQLELEEDNYWDVLDLASVVKQYC